MSSSKKNLFCILLCLIILLSFATAQENIQINGFINDYANIISPEYKSQIETVLKGLYDDKIAEFSIVTINSLEGQDIEGYSLNLAQGKLGDKEKNNGLLLLVAVQDRKYRFEVGRGIEPILNDAKIGRIGRNYLVDNFRNGEYGKGIYEASLAVKSILLDEKDSQYYLDENAGIGTNPRIIIFIVIVFIILWIIVVILSFKARYYKKKKDDDYFGAALLAAWLFGGRKGGHGGGGFGGGGFSGGGFGGFGGGGFGGGGAGGRW